MKTRNSTHWANLVKTKVTNWKGNMVSVLVLLAFEFGLNITTEQLCKINKDVKGNVMRTLM